MAEKNGMYSPPVSSPSKRDRRLGRPLFDVWSSGISRKKSPDSKERAKKKSQSRGKVKQAGIYSRNMAWDSKKLERDQKARTRGLLEYRKSRDERKKKNMIISWAVGGHIVGRRRPRSQSETSRQLLGRAPGG